MSRRRLAFARALVVFAAGAAAGFAAITIQADGVHAAERQVSLGRDITRFVGRAGAGITAASCDAAGHVPGVSAAGGFRPVGPSSLVTGARVQVVAATAGFVRVLLAGAPHRSGSDLIGRDLAARAGLRSGAPLALGSGERFVAQRLPPTPRAQTWANTLFVPTAPAGLVQECWVEVPVGAATVLPLVEAVLDGPRPLSRGPVDRDAVRLTPEEVRAGTLTAGRAGAAAGAVALLVTVTIWWAFRESWALYRAVGFDPSAVAGLAVVDWLLLSVAPAGAGVAWASLPAVADGADASTAVTTALTAVAVSSLGVAWLRVFVARLSLRRSLAGL